MAKEVKDKVKEELREEVRDMVNKRLGHVRIQINKLWLINRIRIIVRGIISEIMVGYAERLGILERNISQVEGLMREVGAAIELDIGRDVKRRDVEGRDVKGRDVERRDVKGRDVKGRDVEGRDVKGRVNTERAVKEMMDETVKTVQSILEMLEKKMMEGLEAKIAEALASIRLNQESRSR
jgi:hypothetical protein